MVLLHPGTVAVWNLEEGKARTQFALPTSPFYLAYSPDGERCVIAYDTENEGVVSIHNAADGSLVAARAFPRGIGAPEWHPSGRWIAAGGDDGSVNLIEAQSGATRTLGRHKAQAALMTFSPDGGYLVSGGWDNELIFWDLQEMHRLFTVALDSYHLQFRADGSECAIRTRSGHIQLHRFERAGQHREFAEDLGARLRHATFSPHGRWLAASAYERLGVWDLQGHGVGVLTNAGAEARLFFASQDDDLFASGDDDCFHWRIKPGATPDAAPQLVPVDLPKPVGFSSLCLISNVVAMTSSQGTRLAGLEDRPAAGGEWIRTSTGLNAVSQDGRWLGIYRPFSPSLYVYGLPGLERVVKLTHPAAIGAVAFSARNDELAIASRAGVELWSTETWQRTRLLTNFIRILYTPDRRIYWLTKDYFGTAGLYDARTLEPLLLLPTGMFPLNVSRDGRYLAVSLDARRLQVWDLVTLREQLQQLGLNWTDPSG
jgi:WD40 repeat protein